jgi:hypothetical protein
MISPLRLIVLLSPFSNQQRKFIQLTLVERSSIAIEAKQAIPHAGLSRSLEKDAKEGRAVGFQSDSTIN